MSGRGAERREFLRRAGTAGIAAWAVPKMSSIAMAKPAGVNGSVVNPGPSSTMSPPGLILYSFEGQFVGAADAGSDAFWSQLENGKIYGKYRLAAGSLPAVSGTSLAIPEFDIELQDTSGGVVIRYASGGDSGGFFADFFGPGSGDGFVFNDGPTQFQLGFASGFAGSGPSVTGAVFATATGPVGEINVAAATARVGG